MNCIINNMNGLSQAGTFLGLIYEEESGDVLAVVLLPGHGMMLSTYHPSRVTLTGDKS
jgi:hypothetical protein